MRGNDEQQTNVFSYINPEDRIPQDHPLRAMRQMTDTAWRQMSPHFAALYARLGRPSIPPERLLRAMLLQILFAIRGESLLMEQLNYNLLFRWFVGLNPDDEVWHPTVFCKNRDRLLRGDIAQGFFDAVLEQAAAQRLLSDEHFTVDGTLIQAWASRRSFQPKDPPPSTGTGARGRKLLRDTHESQTDPEARLYRKSDHGPAVPSYLGHVLMENRSGLIVAACATQSSTTAEREAALRLLDQRGRSPAQVKESTPAITLGADKHYQEAKFIRQLRERKVVPHVAEYRDNPKWPNYLSEQERQHPGFALSQQKRKLVERLFGWGKADSILRQVKLRGKQKVDWFFRLLATAANLVRMVKLIPAM